MHGVVIHVDWVRRSGLCLDHEVVETNSHKVKVGMTEESIVHDQTKASHKSKQASDQEAAILPIPLGLERAKISILPDAKALWLPVLKVLADGEEHSNHQIRDCVRVQFNITSDELFQKHGRGIPVFHNCVALVSANLQGAPHKGRKAIYRVRKVVYKISSEQESVKVCNWRGFQNPGLSGLI